MKPTKDIIQQMEKEFDENFPVGKYGITFALFDGLKFFIKTYTRTLLESFGEEIIGKDEHINFSSIAKFERGSAKNNLRDKQRLKAKEIIEEVRK